MKPLKSVDFVFPVNVGSGAGSVSSITKTMAGRSFEFYEDDDGYIVIKDKVAGDRRIPPTNVKFMVLVPAEVKPSVPVQNFPKT